MSPRDRSTNSQAIKSDRFPDRFDIVLAGVRGPIAAKSPIIGASSVDVAVVPIATRGE